MKFNKKILEAVNKGIKLALDDYEDLNNQNNQTNSNDVIDTHNVVYDYLYGGFVDLGLPSGTKWCKYNLGGKGEDYYGALYSWGELEAKDTYYDCSYKYYAAYTDWSKYKEGEDKFRYSCEHVICDLTKYCPSSKRGYQGYHDKYIHLLPEDDAATQMLDSRFKIPSEKDFKELLTYTDVSWDNEKRGYRFTSRVDKSTYIFLPLAGFKRDDVHNWREQGKRFAVDYQGIYWTSDLNEYGPDLAMVFEFDSSITGKPSITSTKRWYGCSIRPVVK